jgi:hypothetical protein
VNHHNPKSPKKLTKQLIYHFQISTSISLDKQKKIVLEQHIQSKKKLIHGMIDLLNDFSALL